MAEDQSALFESVKLDLLSVSDSVQLAELAEQYPFMLEPEFIAAAEGWAADAQAADGWDVAEGLRERIEVLQELASQNVTQWNAALEAFATARTSEELAGMVQSRPLMRDPSFQTVVEDLIAHAEETGDDDDAAALRIRLDDLRHLIGGATSVTLHSLLELMRAPDPQAARARERDPELVEQAEREALALLRNLRDQQQLLALVAQAPLVLDDPFIARVEAALAEAEQAGDRDLAGNLRARLEGLRNVRAQVQVTLPQTLEAFSKVRDSGELLALAQRVPFVFEERFLGAVERAISELEAGGGRVEADGLRMRLDTLRQLRQQHELADQSPLMKALIDFLNAHDSELAAQVYHEQRALLDVDDAQRAIEQEFVGGDPESQRRIEERGALLRTLRAG